MVSSLVPYVQPGLLEQNDPTETDQDHNGGPDVTGGVFGIGQQQLVAQASALTALVSGKQQIAAQDDEEQQQLLAIQADWGQVQFHLLMDMQFQ